MPELTREPFEIHVSRAYNRYVEDELALQRRTWTQQQHNAPGETVYDTYVINGATGQSTIAGQRLGQLGQAVQNFNSLSEYNRLLQYAGTATTSAPSPLPPEPSLPMEPDMPANKLANTFLVGCDPEMVLVKNGSIVNVSRDIGMAGEVGWDHGGHVVELRPRPAKSTYTLTKRIHTLLKEHPKLTKFESEKWKSGAFFKAQGGSREVVTLGGHVHLDIPCKTPHRAESFYYDNSFVPALDRVTRYFEELDLLPKGESLARRNMGDYGQYADARFNDNRLEYRTMASWLYDPKTTFLCLTGAKLAGIDPELTLDTLRLKNITFNNLQTWFECFKDKDADAQRVCENLLSIGQKKLIGDPDTDVKGVWGERK